MLNEETRKRIEELVWKHGLQAGSCTCCDMGVPGICLLQWKAEENMRLISRGMAGIFGREPQAVETQAMDALKRNPRYQEGVMMDKSPTLRSRAYAVYNEAVEQIAWKTAEELGQGG